ncbi:MAG: hypothetical protein EP344_16615 [Bacteroidetes bacterium]|nr:MAG: hypothetical protein EP344_16615 [Bacteroidota bacterium]
MKLDKALVEQFERGLSPQHLESSTIKANLIGFGEISSIFELEAVPGVVFKRMPMFSNPQQAHAYLEKYTTYCSLLSEAGVHLPEDSAIIVERSPDLTVLYFAQQKFHPDSIGNKVVDLLTEKEIRQLAEKIFGAIYGVWAFNKQSKDVELAIDSQLSNWVFDKQTGSLFYLDTTTPLFKLNGAEQLDPELLLTSAPSFGRAIIRKFFLQDVMDRYYDEHSVNVDLIANLYKEQKPALIPLFIEVANRFSSREITQKEIAAYYREDKFIWQLFLRLRKTDRWLHEYIYRKQYQFILPEKINR